MAEFIPISEKKVSQNELKPSTTLLSSHRLKLLSLTCLSVLGVFSIINKFTAFSSSSYSSVAPLQDYCPTLSKLSPPSDDSLYDMSHFRTDGYKNYSLKVWGGAVKIYTPSFDDLKPVGEDPRWEVFFKFAEYLKATFPRVHEVADLEFVNTHGLVYIIEGSNKKLNPILLSGHQDVVPIPEETLKRWSYPPLDAHFDGDFLWGRGSSDCKNNVIGIFEAVESLLINGFKPKRTIILAFGFDEESGGRDGAVNINKFLLHKFGEKSLFAIIDEGGLGIQDIYGTRFALPSTGEKGYVDITIDLTTVGGHSSVPPKHTGIGIIGHLITLIEEYEYPLDITTENPFFYQLQCEAKFAKKLPLDLRKNLFSIHNPISKQKVLKSLNEDPTKKALTSTTRAVDIVYGGMKINALPEKVTLKINHRISYESSVEIVKEQILSFVSEIAEIYDLGIEAYNQTLKQETSKGSFYIESDSDLAPAPLTSTIDNPSWEILGGTIKHVFEDFAIYPGYDPEVDSEVVVAPSCMTGNTDTKFYWSLTDNIYRFTPIRQASRLNAHGIDERVELDAHVEGVAFYHEYIRNVDAYYGN